MVCELIDHKCGGRERCRQFEIQLPKAAESCSEVYCKPKK